jgi:antitoxin (DNA-binding transcriptional repressor) of toxin-antitoxin stability system
LTPKYKVATLKERVATPRGDSDVIAAGVKDLKNRLSHYLSLVKEGEEVVVTERGKTVARIVREGPGSERILEALRPLVERGIVRLPTRAMDRGPFEPLQVPGKPASEMVLEDRR